MLFIELTMIVWLIVWSIIGSTLGFFTIRYKPVWKYKIKIIEYFKSLFIGIFFAFPVFFYMYEKEGLSISLSIMIAGSVSFCITDLIINFWSKIIEGIIKKVLK